MMLQFGSYCAPGLPWKRHFADPEAELHLKLPDWIYLLLEERAFVCKTAVAAETQKLDNTNRQRTRPLQF